MTREFLITGVQNPGHPMVLRKQIGIFPVPYQRCDEEQRSRRTLRLYGMCPFPIDKLILKIKWNFQQKTDVPPIQSCILQTLFLNSS